MLRHAGTLAAASSLFETRPPRRFRPLTGRQTGRRRPPIQANRRPKATVRVLDHYRAAFAW